MKVSSKSKQGQETQSFSTESFETFFIEANIQASEARKKLCQETWTANSELLLSLIQKRDVAVEAFGSQGEALPLPTPHLSSDVAPCAASQDDTSVGGTNITPESELPVPAAVPSTTDPEPPLNGVERGNKHLAVVWGKTPPTRKYATFKIGERKVTCPVIKMERLTAVRPCYRSWTTLKKNTYVDDDPVLRAIPYFGDNDMGRLDYIERGFEHIIDDKMRKVIFECLTRFGKTNIVLENLKRLLNQMEAEKASRCSGCSEHGVNNGGDGSCRVEEEGSKVGENEETACSKDKVQVSGDKVSGEGPLKKRKTGRGSKSGQDKTEWNRDMILAEYDNATKECEGRTAEEGGGKRSGMDSYRTLFCRRCYKQEGRYDCTAHGTWQPQPPPTATAIAPHPDVDAIGPPSPSPAPAPTPQSQQHPKPPPAQATCNGTGRVDAAALTAAAAAVAAKQGLSERAWRVISAGARICGNDYESIAALCASPEAGDMSVAPEDVRRGLLTTGLLASMVERARQSSAVRRRDAPPAGAGPSSGGGSGEGGEGNGEGSESSEASTATLVWTCPCRLVPPTASMDHDAPANHMDRRRRMQRSRMNSLTYRRWMKRDKNDGLQPEYSPCDCASKGVSCVAESCTCIDNGHFCEKFCGCAGECLNRFPGCQCRSDNKRCRTSSCPCYAAHRECDPDTCMCGAAHSPDGPRQCETCPPPPGSEVACGNLHLLQRNHATLRMGISDVSGWGVFSTRGLDKDEFVYEYMGEVISHDEADRRGSIYDKFNHSFLFNLNSATVVDAGRKGNKTRFANHCMRPNCYTRIMLVHGEHRIGVYAKEAIGAGDELFYDYRHEHAKYQGISAVPDWLPH